MNSKKFVVPLIITIAILSIVLIGTVIFALTKKNNESVKLNANSNNNVLSENTQENLNTTIENIVNNDAENSNSTTEIEQSDIENSEEDDFNKLLFNNKFMSYLGAITGSKLVELIQLTEQVNATLNQGHLITFKSNNLQVINGIAETDVYIISFGYDENGYINTINIDKKM